MNMTKSMKIKLSLLLLVSICTISSCSVKITEPEEIGTVTFDILTELKSINKDEFISYFASAETLNELADNMCSDDSWKELLKSLTPERCKEEYGSDLNELKEAGIKNNITWSDIEFLDFIYEKEEKACVSDIVGKVYFKHNGKTYTVVAGAVYIGDRYQLTVIDALKVFEK